MELHTWKSVKIVRFISWVCYWKKTSVHLLAHRAHALVIVLKLGKLPSEASSLLSLYYHTVSSLFLSPFISYLPLPGPLARSLSPLLLVPSLPCPIPAPSMPFLVPSQESRNSSFWPSSPTLGMVLTTVTNTPPPPPKIRCHLSSRYTHGSSPSCYSWPTSWMAHWETQSCGGWGTARGCVKSLSPQPGQGQWEPGVCRTTKVKSGSSVSQFLLHRWRISLRTVQDFTLEAASQAPAGPKRIYIHIYILAKTSQLCEGVRRVPWWRAQALVSDCLGSDPDSSA